MSIILSVLCLWAWFWWLCGMLCFAIAGIHLYLCSLLMDMTVMRLMGFLSRCIKGPELPLLGSIPHQDPQWQPQQQPLLLQNDQQHGQQLTVSSKLPISRCSSLCNFVNPLAVLPEDDMEPNSRQSSCTTTLLQDSFSSSSDANGMISVTASVSIVAAATALATLAVTKKTSANQVAVDSSAAATAIGAAVLATRLTRSSSGGSSSSCSTPMSVCSSMSSYCCVPPLEFEVSAKEQQELESKAPADLLCPLGRVLMTDPVFTPSGFTYHRPYVLEFLSLTGRDPAGGFPLCPDQLCSNINLRDQVARWLQDNGVLA